MPPAAEKVHLRRIDRARSAYVGPALATPSAQPAGVESPAQLFRFAPATLDRASADRCVTPLGHREGHSLTLGIASPPRSGTCGSGLIKAVEGGGPPAHSAAALRG
jgi:hypothetical protein